MKAELLASLQMCQEQKHNFLFLLSSLLKAVLLLPLGFHCEQTFPTINSKLILSLKKMKSESDHIADIHGKNST